MMKNYSPKTTKHGFFSEQSIFWKYLLKKSVPKSIKFYFRIEYSKNQTLTVFYAIYSFHLIHILCTILKMAQGPPFKKLEEPDI